MNHDSTAPGGGCLFHCWLVDVCTCLTVCVVVPLLACLSVCLFVGWLVWLLVCVLSLDVPRVDLHGSSQGVMTAADVLKAAHGQAAKDVGSEQLGREHDRDHGISESQTRTPET